MRIVAMVVAIVSALSTSAVSATSDGADVLESSGVGCLDDSSPVWDAPRELRDRPIGTPCEASMTGCHGSTLDSFGLAASLVEAVCSLRVMMSGVALEVGDMRCLAVADNELRWEKLAPITLPMTPPSRGPTCGLDDSQCRSLPPLPTSLMPLMSSSSGCATAWIGFVESDEDESVAHGTPYLLGPSEGTRRRVERPPIG